MRWFSRKGNCVIFWSYHCYFDIKGKFQLMTSHFDGFSIIKFFYFMRITEGLYQLMDSPLECNWRVTHSISVACYFNKGCGQEMATLYMYIRNNSIPSIHSNKILVKQHDKPCPFHIRDMSYIHIGRPRIH